MDIISLEFGKASFREKVKLDIPGIILKADFDAAKFGRSGLLKGTIRKRYLLNYLTTHFGENRVTTFDSRPDIDIAVDNVPIKIRTITGKSGVKIKWTIDREKVIEFVSDYEPSCGILLLRIRTINDSRDYPSGLFWIPILVQNKVLKKIGVENYLKQPKPDTNSRGIELNKKALEKLIYDPDTKHIGVY